MAITRSPALPRDWRALAFADQCWQQIERERIKDLGVDLGGLGHFGQEPAPLPDAIERLLSLADPEHQSERDAEIIVSGAMMVAVRAEERAGTLDLSDLTRLAARLRTGSSDAGDHKLLQQLRELALRVANASRPMPPPGLHL